MTDRFASFRSTESGPTALFLDTSGLFAYFHPGVAEHDGVTAFFDRVATNDIPYRPLFTSTYVVDELVTLLLSKGRHEYAVDALRRTLDSDSIDVIRETNESFDATVSRIEEFDDREISFTDHLSAVQMQDRNVTHVLAFDGDFDTMGFEQIPR